LGSKLAGSDLADG